MNINFAVQALDHLGNSHFNRTWPLESIKAIGPELDAISEKAMTAVVKRARVDLSPASFPALKRVLDLLKEEQQKINLASSPADSLPRHKQDQEFSSRFGQQASDHERLGMAMCLQIASGELAGEKLIEGMGYMEKRFPNVGWKDEQIYWIQQQREDREAHA